MGRIRKKSLDSQIQQCLNDAEALKSAEPSAQKLCQERLRALFTLQERQDKLDKTEALERELAAVTAENERLKVELAQVKPTEPMSGISDPSDLAVQGMLARIKSAVPEVANLTPSIVAPEPTPEELALETERKAELERKQQELVQARKDRAELEHQEKLAAVKAEIAAVEEANAQKIAANPELAQSERYKPLTTDATTGYRPQHLRRFP